MEKNNVIEALSEIREASINNEPSLKVWQSKAINIIVRTYGKDSKQEEQIKSIKFRTYVSLDGPRGNNSQASFGSGLASNILANILTNPGLYF